MISPKELVLLTLVPFIVDATYPSSTAWKPLKSKPNFIVGPTAKSPLSIYRPQNHDQCTLHKVAMDQFTYPQYIQYKHTIPDLKQFTLCHFHKFYNHSKEQTFFSYSLPHQPKAILSWISNQDKRSYYMLVVNGHTIHRLNYPIKLFTWYHMCQSWNGKTGEWQVWVNNERVGRGYYNLLVGHTIKSGGIAITGQEQHVHGGGFDILGKSGLQGEMTLLELYKAALTAGKAYINHKHHHVNDYTHDDDPNAQTTRKKRDAINPDISNKRIVLENPDQLEHEQHNSLFHPFGGAKSLHVDNHLSTYLHQDFIHLLPTREDQLLQNNNRAQKPSTQAPATTQTEPAEWEVSQILQACSADCFDDAFKRANVLSWQETPKKLFAGAAYPKVAGNCYNF